MGAQSAGGARRHPGGAVGVSISSPFSQPPFDRFRQEIGEEALNQLRALLKDQRQRIDQKHEALQTDLQGDVKKLVGQEVRSLKVR